MARRRTARYPAGRPRWDAASLRLPAPLLFQLGDLSGGDPAHRLEDGDAATIGARLDERFGFETVLVTRGDEGVVAVADGRVSEQPAFEAETVDPIGTGDAFVGGYLAGQIHGESLEESLEMGAATAALKRTLDGDLAVITREEVDAVRARGMDRIDR